MSDNRIIKTIKMYKSITSIVKEYGLGVGILNGYNNCQGGSGRVTSIFYPEYKESTVWFGYKQYQDGTKARWFALVDLKGGGHYVAYDPECHILKTDSRIKDKSKYPKDQEGYTYLSDRGIAAYMAYRSIRG